MQLDHKALDFILPRLKLVVGIVSFEILSNKRHFVFVDHHNPRHIKAYRVQSFTIPSTVVSLGLHS